MRTVFVVVSRGHFVTSLSTLLKSKNQATSSSSMIKPPLLLWKNNESKHFEKDLMPTTLLPPPCLAWLQRKLVNPDWKSYKNVKQSTSPMSFQNQILIFHISKEILAFCFGEPCQNNSVSTSTALEAQVSGKSPWCCRTPTLHPNLETYVVNPKRKLSCKPIRV